MKFVGGAYFEGLLTKVNQITLNNGWYDSSYREKYLLTRPPDISGRVAVNSRYRSAGRDN
ncbi:hypothetical protein OUZ56_007368 [Daphnia magna]|uniref:Uncharacterized protein n=1 Tax=Daphnia magna TaxID=35525 RepID=A0ABR0AA45_9CRUS|nr:hypothetical protein OUZ56_007368 [Daphnia magna]